MDDDLSFERAYEQMMKARPTPNATIETVKQAVRDRGVVRAIEPHTESDPVAILIQFLTSVGNIVGNCPYYQVEGSRHRANLFNVLVGQARKLERAHHGIAFQKLSGSRTSDGTASASRVVCPPVKGSLMRFATNSRNGTERKERRRWSILASPTSA
jgi:hypothetical protein